MYIYMYICMYVYLHKKEKNKWVSLHPKFSFMIFIECAEKIFLDFLDAYIRKNIFFKLAKDPFMKSCLKKDNFHFINKIVKKPTLKIQGWVRAIKVAGLASFWRNSPIRRMRSNSWGSVYSNLSPTVMRHMALRMGRLNWLAMLIG